MADYFSSSPNFVNPSYATPEQVAQQRAYAAELTKRSGENVNRPAGAFANMITALTAGLERNRANELQNQAAGQNASDLSDLITQLQSGNVNPQTAARVYANPMASPEHRALVGALIAPKAVEDVYGRPGTVSPAAGVRALPVQGNFQPGYRAPESAGSVATTTPFPAPGVPPTAAAPVMAPRAPVPSSPNVWGDKEAEAAGLYPPSGGGGGQASGAGLPPAPAPVSGISPHLKQMAHDAQQIEAEGSRVKAGAGAEGSVIESDVKRAASAPETLKGLGIMKNTIESVGDAMTFGPTAKMSNEARRVIANYAPGLVDEKALAGADAIEKLNLGLAGALSSQLGLNPSDIYRSVASVPGNEKSKAGTLALINMMEQAARNDQYVGTEIYQNSKGNLDAYQLARAAYYQHHPIVNPITGNPVQIDAKNAPAAPTGGVVNVSTPEEAAKLPKGTRFRAPDGSIRMVP